MSMSSRIGRNNWARASGPLSIGSVWNPVGSIKHWKTPRFFLEFILAILTNGMLAVLIPPSPLTTTYPPQGKEKKKSTRRSPGLVWIQQRSPPRTPFRVPLIHDHDTPPPPLRGYYRDRTLGPMPSRLVTQGISHRLTSHNALYIAFRNLLRLDSLL